MTIGRSIPRYGRIEVGQRVQFVRVEPAPTTERATLGRGVESPSTDDPRSANERALLCDECWVVAQ